MYVINGFKDNLISREQQIQITCGFVKSRKKICQRYGHQEDEILLSRG